eukprot:403339849
MIECTFKFMKVEFPDLRLFEMKDGRREDINLDLTQVALRRLKGKSRSPKKVKKHLANQSNNKQNQGDNSSSSESQSDDSSSDSSDSDKEKQKFPKHEILTSMRPLNDITQENAFKTVHTIIHKKSKVILPPINILNKIVQTKNGKKSEQLPQIKKSSMIEVVQTQIPQSFTQQLLKNQINVSQSPQISQNRFEMIDKFLEESNNIEKFNQQNQQLSKNEQNRTSQNFGNTFGDVQKNKIIGYSKLISSNAISSTHQIQIQEQQGPPTFDQLYPTKKLSQNFTFQNNENMKQVSMNEKMLRELVINKVKSAQSKISNENQILDEDEYYDEEDEGDDQFIGNDKYQNSPQIQANINDLEQQQYPINIEKRIIYQQLENDQRQKQLDGILKTQNSISDQEEEEEQQDISYKIDIQNNANNQSQSKNSSSLKFDDSFMKTPTASILMQIRPRSQDMDEEAGNSINSGMFQQIQLRSNSGFESLAQISDNTVEQNRHSQQKSNIQKQKEGSSISQILSNNISRLNTNGSDSSCIFSAPTKM